MRALIGRADGGSALALSELSWEVCGRFPGSKWQEVKEGFPEEATLEGPKGEQNTAWAENEGCSRPRQSSYNYSHNLKRG